MEKCLSSCLSSCPSYQLFILSLISARKTVSVCVCNENKSQWPSALPTKTSGNFPPEKRLWGIGGVWWSGGVGEKTEGCELNLLKKLFSLFALSRLPLALHLMICFIPVYTSLTLFCWSLASSFLLYVSLQALSIFLSSCCTHLSSSLSPDPNALFFLLGRAFITLDQVQLKSVCAKFHADGTKSQGGVRKSRFSICGALANEMCSRSVRVLCQKTQLCSGNIWI